MTAGPVRYENKDGVGIITVDNPPLNVLSRAVRDGLMAAVREAAADSAASAVVLTGAGRTFTAGADITEFSLPSPAPTPTTFAPPSRTCRSPWSSRCTVRCWAAASSWLLLATIASRPRMPGWACPKLSSGCCRAAAARSACPGLPARSRRSTSSRRASRSPRPLAKKAGLIDELAEGDHLAAAIAFVKSKAGSALPPKTRERTDKIEAERGSPRLRREARLRSSSASAASTRRSAAWTRLKTPSTCRSRRASSASASCSARRSPTRRASRSFMCSSPSARRRNFPALPPM